MAKILVETSARHIHVTEEAVEVLFGKGATLTEKKRLSQPTEYACEERVTIVGPKRELKNVIILGPCRKAVQVELSMTDARTIGVAPAVRLSGDVAGTPGCTIIGPAGELEIKEGVIVAKRHIHITPDFAQENGLEQGSVVSVKFDTDGRSAVLGDVVCRIDKTFTDAMHIDTDEANAVGAVPGYMGEIIK